MQMKRLAIISTHPIQYHAPVFRLLAQRGRVDLKVFYSQPPEQTRFDKGFGRVVQWDIPLLEGYASEQVPHKKELIRAVEAFQPDAVMVFGWNFPGHLAAMRYFKGKVPVWFRGDSTLLDEKPGWRRWVRRAVLTWVYRHVDKAFYVGANNKDYFLAHGLREDQLVFAPHAVENERFMDPAHDEKALEWREALGFRPDDFVLLYAGKFEPVKNLAFLIQGVKQYNNQAPKPIHLLLVGNGPLEQSLKDLAAGDPAIHFLPFQNQSMMPVVYRLGNCYCLCSVSETWGLAVNEALACGRPVLVSDKVGCARDLANRSPVGHIFKASSPESLQSAIEETLRDIRLTGDTREQAIEQIKGWNMEEIAKALENG